jgi:hypothetical protein
MTVFLSNTDKLGFLEAALARDIIRAYQQMHHIIDRGHEMWEEVERDVQPSLREAAIQRVRPDAANYVPSVEAWLRELPPLRQRLMGVRS